MSVERSIPRAAKHAAWLVRFGRGEAGRGLVWLALALPALSGFVGLTVDGGRLYLTRQRVVNVCDAGVLAGGRHLRGEATDTAALRADVLDTVQGNVLSAHPEWAVSVSDAALNANPDILIAGYNDTPETNTALSEPLVWLYDDGTPINPDDPPAYAPEEGRGVMVRGRGTSRSTFMAVLGFGATTIRGAATVTFDCAGRIGGSTHIVPIWITGDFEPGDEVRLTLDNGSGNVPAGSYGFISPGTFEPYTANDSAFRDWLQFGPPGEVWLSIYSGGPLAVGTPGVITAYTGWSWGQVRQSLERATGGLAASDPATYGARMQRQLALYPEDTPTGVDSPCGAPPGDDAEYPDIDPGDARIILVPIVEAQFGTGSNALFTIRTFGAFWLNCLGGKKDKHIVANFINYVTPGSGGGPCSGVWVYSLVR